MIRRFALVRHGVSAHVSPATGTGVSTGAAHADSLSAPDKTDARAVTRPFPLPSRPLSGYPRRMKTRLLVLCLLAVVVSLAAAGLRFIAAPAPADAPESGDRVSVNVYSPPAGTPVAARLVLLSGWTCGAAWLHYPALYLSGQGVEVWTVNRRATLYEDRERFRALLPALAGTNATARQQALADLSRAETFLRLPAAGLARIGLRQVLSDLHRVVRAAGADGRAVFLGGWSDGVEFAMAYSLSAFDGLRGHALLKGLVLVDENAEWGTVPADTMTVRARQLAGRIAAGDLYEKRHPAVTAFEAAGMFGATNQSPLAAAFGRPAGSTASLLGWLYNGPGSAWSWLFSCGTLRWSRPLAWTDGGNTPMARILGMHHAPGGVWEWFYPHRILAEYWELGARGFACPELGITPDPVCRLPVHASFSSMTGVGPDGGPGLAWYRRRTGIKAEQVTIVRLPDLKHGDILLSPRAEDRLWKPLAGWLRQVSVATNK